jgi:hypothetical protein
MAFLNGMGLMPGEWTPQQAQAPQQGWQDRIGGLLGGDNALFNIGLGILANNNTKNTSQVLGRGIQQGMQQTQSAKQLGLQNKRFEAQDKRFEREDKEYQRQQDAIQRFKMNNPTLADAVDLDPKLAIKAAYPSLSANSADPYYTLQSTPQGIGKFNVRTGEFELLTGPDGKPIIKSSDSPQLQGEIELAKSKADGSYKIDNSIPGVVQTVTQTAEQANPSLVNPIPPKVPMINGKRTVPAQQMPTNGFNTPYPVTFGAPGTTPTDRAEGVVNDQSIQMRNPSRPNVQGNYVPPVGGIAVPTPEAQAAATETAKAKAEAKFKAEQDLPKSIASGELAIKQVDELLKHPGFATAVGASSKFDPRNYFPGTDAAGFKARFDQSKGGTFLQGFESLKGGGAITAIEGEKATQAIDRMSTATSEEEFKQAAEDYKAAIRTGIDRAKAKAGGSAIMPSGEAMPPRRRVYNRKTGKIE